MDIAFELLVPSETKLEGLDLKVNYYEWQGQSYPQGLPQCEFGHFQLIETPMPTHLKAILPGNFRSLKWRCLSVRGDGLSLLKRRLNADDDVRWNSNELDDLLNLVLDQAQQWVVVFELNHDTIDEVIRCGLRDIEPLIARSLTTEPRGFLAVSH